MIRITPNTVIIVPINLKRVISSFKNVTAKINANNGNTHESTVDREIPISSMLSKYRITVRKYPSPPATVMLTASRVFILNELNNFFCEISMIDKNQI